MDFNKLRNDLQSKYFSAWEYFSNGSALLKIFVRNHPVLLFFHLVFLFFLGVVFRFQGSEILAVMEKIVEKYGKTKIDSNQFLRSREFNELVSEVMLFILCYIIVWLVVQFILAIIRKKMGLEVEGRENEFSLVEITVKFLVMTFVNIILAVFLVIAGIIMMIFTNSVLPFIIFWAILQLNLLYFQQAYYLRNINIVEAFKYNLYISRGNRIRILHVLLIVFAVSAGFNYFSSWLFEAAVKDQVVRMTVNAFFGGVVGLFYTIFEAMAGNLIYLNLEYIDFNTDNAVLS